MYKRVESETARRARQAVETEQEELFDEILSKHRSLPPPLEDIGRERFLLNGSHLLPPKEVVVGLHEEEEEEVSGEVLTVAILGREYDTFLARVDLRLRQRVSPRVNVGARQFLIFDHDENALTGEGDDGHDGPVARLQEGSYVTQVDVLKVAERLKERARVITPGALRSITLERALPTFLKHLERARSRLGDACLVVVVLPRHNDDLDVWFFLQVWPVLTKVLASLNTRVVARIEELKTSSTKPVVVVHTMPAIWDAPSMRACREVIQEDRAHTSGPLTTLILTGMQPTDLTLGDVTGIEPRSGSRPYSVSIIGPPCDTFGDVVGLPLHLYPMIHEVRTYRIPPRLERAPRDFQHLLGQFPRNPKTTVAIPGGYLPQRYRRHPCVAGFHPLRLSQWAVDMTHEGLFKAYFF